MRTLIKELIDIPAQVHRGDFVLNLADGVTDAGHTLRHYVVTPQLVESFEGALTFIKSALDGRASKAAYLHGSFGSGKSHFMAVLHLLLQGNREVRSIEALQGVLARHTWLVGRRFLLVPFHMIGAASMESAVLGGYVEHVARLHPQSPVPAVYRSEALFENARRLHDAMGDARFFEVLNRGAAGDDLEWGDVGAGWDARRFEEALRAPPRSAMRRELVSDLVTTHLPAFRSVARGDTEALVDFDEGLSVISRHAHSLGYDALVLFLDELILWLASNAGNLDFLNRESQKLAKLVESQNAERPVPIVSFAAKQRDLRELVGDNLAGAEMVRLGDSLQWFEGRFHTITLEDRNLPVIASKRLLTPRDATAQRTLDAAFNRAAPERGEVLDALLTREADRAMFRQVYPFSPALVQALVALSAALQRERTALRVMLQLLVDQRDVLAVGDLIPLGDLWDVIGQGAEPFSAEMTRLFEDARSLWHGKLRPLIEREHAVDLDTVRGAVSRGEADRVAWAAWNDARLLKTLLIAELVPQVEAVRDLTPRRLAALNHGTIRSPIPGQEAGIVLRRLQKWAGEAGEIRVIGEGGDPRVKLKLTGVDVEGLLDRVANVDNAGARKLKIRERLFEALGLGDASGLALFCEHTVAWRGTERRVSVIYGNVREMDDSALVTSGDEWRILIDFPFDDAGFGPGDDVERGRRFLAEHAGGALAMLWLPQFFSARTRVELGRLVRIDHLLTGENFERSAAHLPPVQRAEAQAQLENQQSALRARLDEALAAAYGLGQAGPEVLDDSHDHRQFVLSLRPGFTPRLPATGRLGAALIELVRAALAFQFPAHPPWAHEPVLRRGMLRRVLGLVREAAADVDGRVLVEPARRDEVRAIVHPLELGALEEGRTHFVIGTRWRDRLERARHVEAVETPSVGEVRGWLDPPENRSGLTREVSDLLVLTWAEQTNRVPRRHGGPFAGDIGGLPDDVTMASLSLPSGAQWAEALRRAAAVFGVQGGALVNAHNLSALAAAIKARLGEGQAAMAVPGLLADRAAELAVDPSRWPRMLVAREADAVVGRLRALEPRALVEQLASIELASPLATLGHAIAHAGAMVEALRDGNTWSMLSRLRHGSDPAAAEALADLVAGLSATELASALRGVIDDAFHRALALSAPPAARPERSTAPTAALPPAPVDRSGPVASARVLATGREAAVGSGRWVEVRAAIEAALATPGARLSIEWRVEQTGEDGSEGGAR